MSTLLKTITVLLVGAAITHSAQAQDIDRDSKGTVEIMPDVGAYEALSPPNKTIAETIFNRQIVTAYGKPVLSLDQIAAVKQRHSWFHLFRQMKADGLIEAKSFRQLIRHRHGKRSFNRRAIHPRSPATTIVTMASGGQIIIDKNPPSYRTAKQGAGMATKVGYGSGPGAPGYTHSYRSSNGRLVYRGRLHSASIIGH